MASIYWSIKFRMSRLLNNIRFLIIRNRIQFFIFLAISIVLFAFYGLSNDNIFDESGSIIINEGKPKTQKMNKVNDFSDIDYPQVENLIILPCHGIFAPELNSKIGSDNVDDGNRFSIGLDMDNWLLEPFQKQSEDHISFFKHLELSLLELHNNIGNSALVISGGYTKDKIEKSESSSYLQLAENVGFLKNPYFRKNTNILIDEFARDSYENILYSLITFYKRFHKLPNKITIIGFGFKRERFLSSHLVTLGYYSMPNKEDDNITLKKLSDTNHVKYIESGPFLPEDNSMSIDEYAIYEKTFWDDLYKSENNNALKLFKQNPFGSKGSKLYEKKLKRDPWNKQSLLNSIYTTDNEILNNLIKIDQLEINDAWNLYNREILPHFPLYQQ